MHWLVAGCIHASVLSNFAKYLSVCIIFVMCDMYCAHSSRDMMSADLLCSDGDLSCPKGFTDWNSREVGKQATKVGSNWCERGGMVSFDVVSLFTRVPVSEALWVIEGLLADKDPDNPTASWDCVSYQTEPPHHLCPLWRWLLQAGWGYGHGSPSVTCCGQHLHAGLWAEGTDKSPTEALTVVTLCGWHLCHLECCDRELHSFLSIWVVSVHKSNSRWRRPKDQFPS